MQTTHMIHALNPYSGKRETFFATDAKMADSMKQRLVIRGMQNITVEEM